MAAMAIHYRKAIALLVGIAGLLLLLAAADRVRVLVQSFVVPSIDTSALDISDDESSANSIDTELVINAHLFGEIEAEYVALATVTEETELPLTLKGVLAGDEPASNAALIELENGLTKLFRVDREVMEGVVLRAVYPDKVVISYRGRNESLGFPVVNMSGIEESTKVAAVSRSSTTKLPAREPNPTPVEDSRAEVEDPGFAPEPSAEAEYSPPAINRRDEIRKRLEMLRRSR